MLKCILNQSQLVRALPLVAEHRRRPGPDRVRRRLEALIADWKAPRTSEDPLTLGHVGRVLRRMTDRADEPYAMECGQPRRHGAPTCSERLAELFGALAEPED